MKIDVFLCVKDQVHIHLLVQYIHQLILLPFGLKKN